jgi:shikimate kinase
MSTNSCSGTRSPLPSIVALTGFMAAGKSTVGRVFGSLLRWRFLDLDAEIECRSKRQVRDIFATQGEPGFRKIEADALRSVLKQVSGPTVIALGGGTFVPAQNARLLQRHGAHVVFLELAVDELLQRCRCAGERPAGNPRPLAADAEAFCALYQQRLPSYRKAELTVNTAGKTADEVVREIAEALHLAVIAR